MTMTNEGAPHQKMSAGRRSLAHLLRFFAPAPDAELMLTDPVEVKRQYRYWQRRILLSTIIGYSMFYFVRKNLSVAMPGISEDLGIGKGDLGLFLTLHGVLYGVAKFGNGFLADRANARVFMAAGLVLSALVNVFFGLSSAVVIFGLLWMLNGWFQGMGFPPCARLMAHWFSPKELATKFSMWNTSHSIGAGLVVVLCGYLATYNWRLCFFVPAGLAVLCAVFLIVMLRDTPPSLGLPEVEGTERGSHTAGLSSALLKQVFVNKYIWLLSMSSFCLYTVRGVVLDWGPSFLTEMKHIPISHAGWVVGTFEASGVAGMLLSGWLTDRVFGGRGARLCVFSMALSGLSLMLFWKLPSHSMLLNIVLLCLTGFFLYGPQALVGTLVVNLATKRIAATAVGFSSLFSYASTVFSGWGLGNLVEAHGWNAGFAAMLAFCGASVLFFASCWRAKAHGYANPETGTDVEYAAAEV